LTSSDAAKAADLLGASRVVPLHVRGWAHFTEGPEQISAAFADAGLSDRLHSIAPGASETF
jgi:L-ascorbate metabolism protein UlaG (beta-lactamase superfamily)